MTVWNICFGGLLSVRLQCARIIFVYLAACYAGGLSLNAQILTKEELQKETAVYEASSHDAEPPKVPSVQAGRIWSHLATLYQDAGRYGESQIAYEHAMRLLTMAPVSQSDLAVTIDNLGTLYMETGNVKEAEQMELKALKIREAAGLKSDLPQSWYHLATLFLRGHRATRSGEFARLAVDAFSRDKNTVPEDKIGSLLVLASSDCQSHRYAGAIAQLQTALQLTIQTYGTEHYPTGLNMFLLGYAHWKNGDLASAQELMERGYDIVGKEMAWHPAYLYFMAQYAHFLRDEHKRKEAQAIERAIKEKRARLNADPAYGSKLQLMDAAALF
jgi:tetratricopeptide (TPR) repeat protein